jgi:hypothetical protein
MKNRLRCHFHTAWLIIKPSDHGGTGVTRQGAVLWGNTALAQRITNRLRLYNANKPYLDAALAHDAGQ